MLLPTVYSFNDYRAFLKAFYQFHKQQNPAYSFKTFSLKASIQSPNLFKLVMDGDKNLSTTTILKFAKGLGLDELETEYFESLVLENQASETFEKAYYQRRLRGALKSKSKRSVRIAAKTSLFDSALTPALVVFLDGKRPEDAGAIVQTVFPLTLPEISRTLASLEKEKIIKIRDGRYAVDFDHAIFHRKPSHQQLKGFLKQQLELSNKAFARGYDKQGKFFSHSMGVSRSRFPEAIDLIKKAISEVNQTSLAEEADDVLQLNIQAFLLSDIL